MWILLALQSPAPDGLGRVFLGSTQPQAPVVIAEVLGQPGLLHSTTCQGRVARVDFVVPFSELVIDRARYPMVRQTATAGADAQALTLALHSQLQEMGWKSLPLGPEHFDLQPGPEPKRRQISRRYTWGPYAREMRTVCMGTDWASTCEVRLVVGEGC
ncbi:MAG: hypothetical protein ACI9VR_003071 [Cognaticolwellia sp.]|jgi:hypothetical protein